MIELEQDDIPEETEYESIDLEDEESISGTLKPFSAGVRSNSFGFERISYERATKTEEPSSVASSVPEGEDITEAKRCDRKLRGLGRSRNRKTHTAQMAALAVYDLPDRELKTFSAHF